MVSLFGVREDRAKAIDYLTTWEEPFFGFFYLKNPRDTYDWSVFFQPLYKEAWYGVDIQKLPTILN